MSEEKRSLFKVRLVRPNTESMLTMPEDLCKCCLDVGLDSLEEAEAVEFDETVFAMSVKDCLTGIVADLYPGWLILSVAIDTNLYQAIKEAWSS